MSAETMGTHPHVRTENNGQPTSGQPQRSVTADEHLTPDRPPQPMQASSEGKQKRPRGFAAMDRTVVSEIARKGGKAAHSAGTAHEFTSEEARVAGRKGGRATHAKRRQGGDETVETEAHETRSGQPE